ncbi:hypothetical protein Poli38472_014277 [Pythium oligandrum]|uniref:Uncharacterized protein n=1 Tax=Pythium oligandrum TaxID=41045 RepID=A0A8K1CK64_PYTOL|nr:hypothetical protein Poli38472_014277 [Pythium oligandrum]|eukprot:TMW64160.1 hypothetical protein Poli38472_014277 [Pythium oligandrum]
MVRALFVVATLALSCSAVLAHEGHDHGSMAAGSTAGSHAGSGEDHHNHDAGETGSAHGSATGSSGVSGTAAVPTPAPSSATTVFSIALPLTAAAVATLAATN